MLCALCMRSCNKISVSYLQNCVFDKAPNLLSQITRLTLTFYVNSSCVSPVTLKSSTLTSLEAIFTEPYYQIFTLKNSHKQFLDNRMFKRLLKKSIK